MTHPTAADFPAMPRISATGDTIKPVTTTAPQTFTPLPSPSPEEAARFCLINEILVERIRQISGEGYQPATDDTYVEGELAQAAATYALSAAEISGAHAFWPWHMHTYRPGLPRRDLIKAAALILAEIERLDRLTAQPKGEGA